METGNTRLLWSKDKLTINDGVFDFAKIWEGLNEEYKKLTRDSLDDQIFRTVKGIEDWITKYSSVQADCQALMYGRDEEIQARLESQGYKITGNFIDGVKAIMSKSEHLLIKAERLKTKLPKAEEKPKNKASIKDVIASYGTVLGYSLDFNMVVTEFIATKKQVENKIKAEQNG